MSDSGSHFNSVEVHSFCSKWGTNTHVTLAYSPWVNGLVEGMNKLLLHILKQICTPELGEDDQEDASWDELPNTWPLHLDDAILALNRRLLPNLKFSPKERSESR